MESNKRIGYFPSPFFDELMYSVLSRYHLVSNNNNYSITLEEITSNSVSVFRIDMFPFARKLEEKLKHFNYLKAEEIVEGYTFYNYYSKFMKEDNITKLLTIMLNERSSWITNEIYKFDVYQYNQENLHFCLECFHEEIENKIPYWHITHNLPGVVHCHIHGCNLVESDVKFNSKKLIALTKEVSYSQRLLLSEDDEKLLRLISEQTILVYNSAEISNQYLSPYILFLYELGYIENNKFDISRFKSDLSQFFSEKVKERLNINTDKLCNRLESYLQYKLDELPPLYHILTIIYCGKRIQDVRKNSMNINPINSIILNQTICKCEKHFYNGEYRCWLNYNHVNIYYTCSTCGNDYYINSNGMVELNKYGERFINIVMDLLITEDLSASEVCRRLSINKSQLKDILLTSSRK